MAWTSGFFNSVDGDRKYNADQMSQIFDGLITQGVYESIGDKLSVQPNNGMTIQIGTGRGWFGSRWVHNDSEYLITLEDSDVLLNRYAAICVRADLSDSIRTAVPYVKYSDFASSPVKPTMTRTETVKEYCLAYVYIGGGVSSITAADITDTRADTDLCGWVTGLIEQVDSTTLWNQWQALFDDFMADLDATADNQQAEFDQSLKNNENNFTTWFDAIKDTLDENPTTAMAADIVELQGRITKQTIELGGLAWDRQDDNSYIQTIDVPGVTDDNEIMVSPLYDFQDVYIRSGIMAIFQHDNIIVFKATAPEDVDIFVNVVIMNI